jgi:hypothetical protein
MKFLSANKQALNISLYQKACWLFVAGSAPVPPAAERCLAAAAVYRPRKFIAFWLPLPRRVGNIERNLRHADAS